MTRRRALVGSLGLLGYVAAYAVACRSIPEGFARAIVSDIGFILPQVAAFALCCLAFRASTSSRDRWIWALVALWLAFNIFGDSAWAHYELVRRVEVPVPSLADVGYLPGYAAAIAAVLVAAWKTSGRLRMVETFLDSAMFTIGAAGLMWPLVLGPLLQETGTGTVYCVTLAYPLGDLLFVLAFASFFLGHLGSGQTRPRPYLLIVCLAFLCQAVADTGYLALTAANGDYGPGSWLDPVWLLAFAVAGIAALVELQAPARAVAQADVQVPVALQSRRPKARHNFRLHHGRILIPYVALPLVAGMVFVQVKGDGWHWSQATAVLAYLGAALVGLLVLRQYVTLVQNRRLNATLTLTSRELEARVDDLADLNERLEVLNNQSHHLNSLRELQAVATGGLELACTFAKSLGGWVGMADGAGVESVVATQGAAEDYCPDDPVLNAAWANQGELRALPLRVRDEHLGTMWLIKPAGNGSGSDLLPVIATHLATALDNAKRYEEALHLAEKDALTGLFNHRGIHRRLAGAALRAQQGDSELSLVMIDLDDFKLLNDTYGHPAGDAVLKQVSDAVRAVLRHADLAGRVGGDELLLVLPNTGSEGSLQLAERLRATLAAQPYVTAGGHSIPVRLSLGVATFPHDAQSLGQLIETADSNLYASKQQGGDTTTGSPPREVHEADTQGLLGVAGRLLDVVGARDHYTRRHSENVVLYALSLGEALGLTDDSMCTLHVAAMLHDVGNVGVPSDLLRTPTLLSAGEHDMVRRHADIGADVINDMARLARVAETVRAHHEHHDGNGYPAESTGDDIPLLSRILAIADAYSAMTLERPYRKSMTQAQARAELLRVAGTQLDPALVTAFVDILEAQERRQAEAGAAAG
jgi:diguanylate cyclase (GGDEF)-like protein